MGNGLESDSTTSQQCLICAKALLRLKVFSLPVPVGQVSFVVRLPYVTDLSIITQFEKGIELLPVGSC